MELNNIIMWSCVILVFIGLFLAVYDIVYWRRTKLKINSKNSFSDKFRLWYKQNLMCGHHWHVISERKVKAASPICSRDSSSHSKYLVKHEDCYDFIHVVWKQECCHCGKIEINECNRVIKYQRDLDLVMAFPDIDDEPLTK